MHFYLFDQILELHVCTSLGASLARLGHKVTASGQVWRGHRFPKNREDVSLIHDAVDRVLSEKPDVILNFRASSLLPEHLSRLSAAGIRTMVWQPDDPVLYGVCYSHVMDLYDDVLLCAGRRVIDYYHYKGHKAAINMPFWVDTCRYAYGYDKGKIGAAVFLGNGVGAARKDRYDALCSLLEDISIYGKFGKDTKGKVKGVLSEDEIIDTIPRYKLAINLVQHFGSYRGTGYDFPGLALLGSFFLPSRAVQYASFGIPMLTIQASDYDPMHYPPGLRARDFGEARDIVSAALQCQEKLNFLSVAARNYAIRHLSSDSRALLLDAICRDVICVNTLTEYERNYIYRWID